jgi:formate hydrogenlyase subunit 4
MSIFLSLLTQLLHTGLMLAAAPSMAGIMGWLDALLSGRPGPPLPQPWRDLARLSRKSVATQEHVSVVTRAAPAVGLGAILTASALVPSFTTGMAFSPLADVLVIVSLMTLSRVVGGLVALDSGAALPGLAAQVSSARAILAEPALTLTLFSLTPMSASFNLDTIISQQHESMLPTAASGVTLCALLILVFADARGVDRGYDHMLSGSGLAAARMTGWLRRLIWFDLIGGVFIPAGMAAADSGPLAWLIGLAAWAIRLVVFMLGLAVVQTMLGQMSRNRMREVIGVAALLALLASIMALASVGLA